MKEIRCKKIFLAVFIAAVSAAAFIGCGKKEKEQNDDVKSKEDINYEALYNANKGSKLLEKYNSVQYDMTTITGEKDDEGENKTSVEKWSIYNKDNQVVLIRQTDKVIAVYMDGTCYYKDSSNENNPRYSQGWFMDGVYEEYVDNNVDTFLIDSESSEDFDNIDEKDDKYVIMSYVGEKNDEKYYYRYTADKETLELDMYEAVIIKESDGKKTEEVVATGVVTLGESIEEPSVVAEIKSGDVNIRRITVHQVGEDGNVKEDFDIIISANATLLAGLKEGYGLYISEEADVPYDDSASKMDENGAYPNNECYLVYKEE